jgi:hypothetical protein
VSDDAVDDLLENTVGLLEAAASEKRPAQESTWPWPTDLDRCRLGMHVVRSVSRAALIEAGYKAVRERHVDSTTGPTYTWHTADGGYALMKAFRIGLISAKVPFEELAVAEWQQRRGELLLAQGSVSVGIPITSRARLIRNQLKRRAARV